MTGFGIGLTGRMEVLESLEKKFRETVGVLLAVVEDAGESSRDRRILRSW